MPVQTTESLAPGPIAPASRGGATGYALAQLLLFVPIALAFVLIALSSVLVTVWVGIPLLSVVLPLGRALANAHRRMAGQILGEPVPAPYLPLAGNLLVRTRVQALDPQTWRDLLWMLWAVTAGVAVSLITVLLLILIVTGWTWWYGALPLMRGRSVIDRALLSPGRTEKLEQRVHVLTESRADVVDHSATEIRRIERDLHDGPQARLAAVSLSLGMAEDLFETDPDAARQLLNDARSTSSTALGELRDLVRGILPPVLADRGLDGAVRALALDMSFEVGVDIDVPQRLSAPVESAVYFAVAECLANVAKHSGAQHAWVVLEHNGESLTCAVGDDGRGGADPTTGTGLAGIATRLAAFDATMTVSSPIDGPTILSWEVPCASSSPRTTPSSGPV